MWILKLVLFEIILSVTTYGLSSVDYANDQLPVFKEGTLGPIGPLTTNAGAPITKNETVTVNQNLLFNEYFIDSFESFVRERITERVVHGKGSGAFGYFEVTNNISYITSAKLFNKDGKKTKVAVRFSLAFTSEGGSELNRQPRGFAIKFYTEDGNLDILNINSPVFPVKDPIKFISLKRVFNSNPQTGIAPDYNMKWDFISLNPETLYSVLILFSDQGIPDGYRHMNGYAIHPYEVVNDKGEIRFLKFVFKTQSGIKTLTSEQAAEIQGKNLDYFTKDLYNAIANGDKLCWKLYVQVMTLEEVMKASFSVFDVTREWPSDTTTVEVGNLVLNENPINYFAEVEQIAFSPSSLVPGILGGIDSMFQSRRFSYRNSQVYRLGKNFRNIKVNRPSVDTFTYNRDGFPPVLSNMKNVPNYYPNSFNGPVPNDASMPPLYHSYVDPKPNNFDQACKFYESLPEDERNRTTMNIAQSLSKAEDFIQHRTVQLFKIINIDLAVRIKTNLLQIENRRKEYNQCIRLQKTEL